MFDPQAAIAEKMAASNKTVEAAALRPGIAPRGFTVAMLPHVLRTEYTPYRYHPSMLESVTKTGIDYSIKEGPRHITVHLPMKKGDRSPVEGDYIVEPSDGSDNFLMSKEAFELTFRLINFIG